MGSHAISLCIVGRKVVARLHDVHVHNMKRLHDFTLSVMACVIYPTVGSHRRVLYILPWAVTAVKHRSYTMMVHAKRVMGGGT